MTQRKVEWLSDISDPDSNGIVYVNMKFDDGTLAYKGAKPDAMTDHYAALQAFLGSKQLVEIELEDTGKKTQKGAVKYKLVGYPGWSAAPAEGGGKSFAASWYNSEAGVHFTQERMDRRTALMQAVEWVDDLSAEQTLIVADSFYAWLRASGADHSGASGQRGEGQTDATSPAPASVERTPDPIPASTSAPSLGEGAGAAGPWGEAVQPIGVEGTASSEVHIHEYTDTLPDGKKTRDGWVVCSCGHAEQVKVKRA